MKATAQSPKGEIVDLATLPKLDAILRRWKYVSFTQDGKAVTAEIKEGVAIRTAEKMPSFHVPPPMLRPDSNVTITLQRSKCFGFCPEYTVTIGTDAVVFDGKSYVVATGKHSEAINPNEVRKLAERFVAADFYSMENEYYPIATDVPSCMISIEIDGRKNQVLDDGDLMRMPAIITDLEDETDAVARTDRWVKGSDGLVAALKREGYNFQTYDAQIMLKRAAENSQTTTVRDFLAAGVPLQPLSAPPKQPGTRVLIFDRRNPMNREVPGWLSSAYKDPETLRVFIHAGASKADQDDKDQALIFATNKEIPGSVRALINYGADPHPDPTQSKQH